MIIERLKTNYQVNPLGIDVSKVTLSWEVSEAKGKFTKSARVLIATDRDFNKLVFDSGEGKLNAAAFTPEVKFCPGETYYWKVSVTDDAGDSAESATATFEGGHPAGEWTGDWIRPAFTEEIHPRFIKKITISAEQYRALKRARLYICGVGLYEAQINGEKVGNQFLTPYFTDYRYWAQYQTYDVASFLHEGENTIEVLLGNGWYKGKFGYLNAGQLMNYYGKRYKLIADLYLYDDKNKATVYGTDKTWQAVKSPVLLSGIYDGENYDANIQAQYEAGEMIPSEVKKAKTPKFELSPMTGVPVTRHEVLPVAKIITTKIGETVLDFGQEISGYVTFKCTAPEGAHITLTYSEVLQNGNFYRDNLRTARAEYHYISDGKVRQARPLFTFFGFRYVKVTGVEVNDSNVGDFEAWALYSDIEETGSIETSDEKINRLILNTKWSEKDNFVDIPTDCPQRDERCGWTGDAEIFSSAASFHMQTPQFFRKYMKDMKFEQDEKGGAVPYVVPDVLTVARIKNAQEEYDMSVDGWGEAGSTVWGDAATIIPWNTWLHFGNIELLKEQYDNMKDWVDFIVHMDETYCGGKRLWTCGFHFGDWLSLDAEGDSREGGTNKYFVASVFYMYSAQLVAKAAKLLGNLADEAHYAKLAEEVREAIRKEYMDAQGNLAYNTQTAYTLGICMDLFNEDEMEEAGNKLSKLLKDNNDHLLTGFVGTPYLNFALSKTGHIDQAYTLLFNEDYPSWLYEVNLGATTIWERWNSLLPDGSISSTGMNSLNHYAYGSIVEWMYRKMCGLDLLEEAPGAKKLRFAPEIDDRLSFVKADFRSIAGMYRAGWKKDGNRITYHFTVPFDAEMEVDLREKLADCTLNGAPYTPAAGEIFTAGEYEICGTVM